MFYIRKEVRSQRITTSVALFGSHLDGGARLCRITHVIYSGNIITPRLRGFRWLRLGVPLYIYIK